MKVQLQCVVTETIIYITIHFALYIIIHLIVREKLQLYYVTLLKYRYRKSSKYLAIYFSM